jgi:hypothetical protein
MSIQKVTTRYEGRFLASIADNDYQIPINQGGHDYDAKLHFHLLPTSLSLVHL